MSIESSYSMFKYVLLLGLLHLSASAGEIVQFPNSQSGVNGGFECSDLLAGEQLTQLPPRLQNVTRSVLSIARGRVEPSEWEKEDPASDNFYRQSFQKIAGLGPKPRDSVVLYGNRSGLFIVIQVVRDQDVFDIVDVIEMMRRFGDPLVDKTNVGIEIWVGRQASKSEVLEAASGDFEAENQVAVLRKLHQIFSRDKLLNENEILGEFQDHVVGHHGPSLYWCSLRLAMAPNRVTPERVGRIVSELAKATQEVFNIDVNAIP